MGHLHTHYIKYPITLTYICRQVLINVFTITEPINLFRKRQMRFSAKLLLRVRFVLKFFLTSLRTAEEFSRRAFIHVTNFLFLIASVVQLLALEW